MNPENIRALKFLKFLLCNNVPFWNRKCIYFICSIKANIYDEVIGNNNFQNLLQLFIPENSFKLGKNTYKNKNNIKNTYITYSLDSPIILPQFLHQLLIKETDRQIFFSWTICH